MSNTKYLHLDCLPPERRSEPCSSTNVDVQAPPHNQAVPSILSTTSSSSKESPNVSSSTACKTMHNLGSFSSDKDGEFAAKFYRRRDNSAVTVEMSAFDTLLPFSPARLWLSQPRLMLHFQPPLTLLVRSWSTCQGELSRQRLRG